MATVKSKAKRKERKHVESGAVIICLLSTTRSVTITDSNGNTIAWASAGGLGFKGLVRAHHLQLRWQLNRQPKLQLIRVCVRQTYSSRVRALAVKRPFVHCRLQESKSAALRTLHRFRIMAAVLQNAEEYKDNPFAYHFGAARRRRRTFG